MTSSNLSAWFLPNEAAPASQQVRVHQFIQTQTGSGAGQASPVKDKNVNQLEGEFADR